MITVWMVHFWSIYSVRDLEYVRTQNTFLLCDCSSQMPPNSEKLVLLDLINMFVCVSVALGIVTLLL